MFIRNKKSLTRLSRLSVRIGFKENSKRVESRFEKKKSITDSETGNDTNYGPGKRKKRSQHTNASFAHCVDTLSANIIDVSHRDQEK